MTDDTHNPEGGVPAIHLVPFHGDTIATLEHGGTHYVAMRRVVENMGLAWQPQHAKLTGQTAKFSCHDIVTAGADGKRYAMLCMPIERLQIWLAGINANKVRADLRDKVERYQAESAIALHDYWTRGFASREGATFDTAALERKVDRIAEAVAGLLVMHDDRRAVAEMVSVKQLLDEANVPPKGRNSINRKMGRELKNEALLITSKGAPGPHRRCAHTGTWLYARDFADRYMTATGRGLVADYLARLTGQTVIPFPVPAKKRPDDTDSSSEGAPA